MPDVQILAHTLALQGGMSLMVQNKSVFGVYADGTTVLVCHYTTTKNLWVKVALILKEDAKRFKSEQTPYYLRTPTGGYLAPTFCQLWKNFLQGKKERLHG